MSTFFRQAANAARNASRLFSSTTASRKDLVQDIYVREIKAYKPAPVAKDAHVGVVKAYSLPPKPQPPSLPTDLASELSAYDAVEPTKASEAPAATGLEEAAGGAEAYLTFLEQDLPKAPAHH